MAASLAREFLFQDCVGESESNVSKNAKSRSDRSDGLLMSLGAGWPFSAHEALGALGQVVPAQQSQNRWRQKFSEVLLGSMNSGCKKTVNIYR